MKKHFWPLLLTLGLTLWLTFSLLRPGWFDSHDGIYHIRRVGEMTEMLKLGYFPVRWGLFLDNSYGTPIFNYVYPGPYYLASFLKLITPLGVPTILKLLAIGSLGGGALAWYVFFQKKSRLAGVIAATLYLTTPYQLVNLFVRFSLGEIMVLGILPWVLVMYQYLAKQGRLLWYSPLPLFAALISHNFLGLLGMGVILTYSFFSFPNFRLLLKTTLLSLLLASFFLLPMLFERSLVLSGVAQDYSFHYFDHFVMPFQLLYSRWDYWYSMPGIVNDGMTFQLGFASLSTVFLALILFLRHHSRSLAILFLLYLATIFLMLPMTRFVWNHVPILQVMQFPWRLLGIAAFVTPLFLLHLKPTPILLFLVLFLGLINTRNYRSPRKFWDSTEFATEYALIKDKTATSLRQELVPRWAVTERWQNVLVSSDQVAIELDSASTQGKIIFSTVATGTESATVHKNFFPSWQGQVDGQPLILAPTVDGAISVPLAPGAHTYTIKLGSTLVEIIANALSLLTLLYLILLKFRYVR